MSRIEDGIRMPFSQDFVPPLRTPRNRVSRYLLALLIVAAATLLRLALDVVLNDQVPYFVYVGAVVVATWFTGVEGGILATFVATFAGNYFFVPPRHDLDFRPEDVGAMLTFAALSLALVWTVGRWRRAEAKARQIQADTVAVLNQMPVGVMIADASGTLQFGNAATETIFGRTVRPSSTIPEWRRHASYQSFFPDGRPMEPGDTPMARALRDGDTIAGEELTIVRGDGSTRILSSYAAPVRDQENRTTAVVVAMLDVTEQKRAEGALRESEARFRSVLDSSRDVIYRVGLASGRYEYISPSAASMVGYSANNLAGMNADASRSMVHPDDLPALEAAMARALTTGKEEAEYRQRTRSGDYRWMSNHMAVTRDSSGRPQFRDGNIRDVTEQKRLEATLRDAVGALENASRVKDEFLATLSHELRTPLNAILGWSDMLLRPGLPADTQQKALESISRNARAQSALISDILDVSRIITGKLRLDWRPVDLGDVVRAACESIQPAADAKGVEVRAVVERRPVLVGDPDRLQQVMWNLLSNAVKFCDRGGRIDVDVRRVDSQVRVVVRDNGAGIPEDFLPHVFERFRQADASTTRTRSGLGLGLAIVRSLIELHGGTVAAESAGEGCGASFTIVLPVRAVFDPARDLGPIASGHSRGAIGPASLEGLHVVAVDDQEEARVLIAAVLERFGARVTVCSTAEQALAAVTRERPDVLLADIGMPAVDGYELIRRIRTLPDNHAQTLPAVALTAYGGVHDRAQALAAGYWEHLAKPIMPDALVTVVAGLTGRGVKS
jgi:PAS domain S-box-containing protein